MADQAHDEHVQRTMTCPITQAIMQDPVICPDGHSFERAAIEAWLKTNQTNPVTRKPLKLSQLTPNRALKESIDLYRKQHPSTGVDAEGVDGGGDGASAIPALPTPSTASGSMGTPRVAVSVFNEGNPDGPTAPRLPGAPPVPEGFARKLVQVQIDPANTSGTRTPCDVVCVVDVSGSMCTAAKAVDADGKSEDTGLSVLDVTKHAVSTVMAVLGESDRFSLVSYSNSAKVECGLTAMSRAGRARASSALNRLQPTGSTNLWDGLQKAFDTLREAQEASDAAGTRPRHQAILLLTDGCPNILPPRGHLPTMRRYLDRYPLNCCVHTFGFGYQLDSTLLAQIANEGNGQYAFIPDAGLVGTVFVNALSNILSTLAKNVKVQLELDDGAQLVEDSLLGLCRSQKTSWGIELALGALNHGQARTVAVHVDVPQGAKDSQPSEIGGSVKMEFVDGAPACPPGEVALQLGAVPMHGPSSNMALNTVLCRAALANALDVAVGANLSVAQRAVATATRFVEARAALAEKTAATLAAVDGGAAGAAMLRDAEKAKADTEALLQDLKGECTLAFANEKDSQRWGQHYVKSLAFAHRTQRCNNFKDPGVQVYGGAMFTEVRDAADDVFLQLPAPTPSRREQLVAAAKAQARNKGQSYKPKPSLSRPVNMATYYNCGGGCIAGECVATLADGTTRPVQMLRAGDVVATSVAGTTAPAVIRCVVATATKAGSIEMAVFDQGALKITPWHPVRKAATGAQWQFPNDAVQGRTEVVDCPKMYTFVLEPAEPVSGTRTAPGLVVGGMECAALGHCIDDDAVLRHEFLGTGKVVEALEKCAGWERGLVQLRQGDYVRDPNTQRIIDIVQHEQL